MPIHIIRVSKTGFTIVSEVTDSSSGIAWPTMTILNAKKWRGSAYYKQPPEDI